MSLTPAELQAAITGTKADIEEVKQQIVQAAAPREKYRLIPQEKGAAVSVAVACGVAAEDGGGIKQTPALVIGGYSFFSIRIPSAGLSWIYQRHIRHMDHKNRS
jgi:hypothetical protein